MNRRGVALLASLWLIVVLSVVAGGALAAARIGLAASQNRIWLRRSEWAREACAQILISRWRGTPVGLAVAETDLGGGVRCHATSALIAAKANVNLADPATLRRLIGADSLVAALLDWEDADDLARPEGAEAKWYRSMHRELPRNGALASMEELALIRGFDRPTVARLRELLTTDGNGTVDLNGASLDVLAALPGMTRGALAEIEHRRALGRRIQGLGDLAGTLEPGAREVLMASYQSLERQTATASEELLATVTGGVVGTGILRSMELTLTAAGSRLAVTRRKAQ
ncbi:MAG: type II secretion system protein GspK [Gemmatimonadota bacterium]|nr:type II secretion system protein GspK [Gemmatimonadota bacterium]